MEATMTPVGEMSADELGATVRGGDAELTARAVTELQRRAGDGEEDAVEVLEALTSEKGAALANPEPPADDDDPERTAALAAEQAALDRGEDPPIAGAPPAAGEAESAYEQRLAEAREREGLDATSALPTAADDAGAVPQDLAVQGDGTQLEFRGFEKAVGGKKPSESKVKLVGGAFEVPKGAFAKGSTVLFEVRTQISGVGFDDKTDSKTGQVVDCTRSHKARIIGAVRVESSTADRLDALHATAQAYLAGDASENDLRAELGMPSVEEAASKE